MNQGTAIQPSMDGSDGRSRPPALVHVQPVGETLQPVGETLLVSNNSSVDSEEAVAREVDDVLFKAYLRCVQRGTAPLARQLEAYQHATDRKGERVKVMHSASPLDAMLASRTLVLLLSLLSLISIAVFYARWPMPATTPSISARLFRFTAVRTRGSNIAPSHPGIEAFGLLQNGCEVELESESRTVDGASVAMASGDPHVEAQGWWLQLRNTSTNADDAPTVFVLEASDDGHSWRQVGGSAYRICSDLRVRFGTHPKRTQPGDRVHFDHRAPWFWYLGVVGGSAVLSGRVLVSFGFALARRAQAAKAIFLANFLLSATANLFAALCAILHTPISTAFAVDRLLYALANLLLAGTIDRAVEAFVPSLLSAGVLLTLWEAIYAAVVLGNGSLFWIDPAVGAWGLVLAGLGLMLSWTLLKYRAWLLVRPDQLPYDEAWHHLLQTDGAQAELSELHVLCESLGKRCPDRHHRPHTLARMRQPADSWGSSAASSGRAGGAGFVSRPPLDPRAPVKCLDQLLIQANALNPILRRKVEGWAVGAEGMVAVAGGSTARREFKRWADTGRGGSGRQVWAGVKGRERAMQKLLACYRKQPSSLVDLCRQRLVFEGVAQLTQALHAIAQDPDIRLVRVTNRLDKSYDSSRTAGYRDVRLNLRIESPLTWEYGLDTHVCELQLALVSFASLQSEESHRRFLRFRSSRPSAGSRWAWAAIGLLRLLRVAPPSSSSPPSPPSSPLRSPPLSPARSPLPSPDPSRPPSPPSRSPLASPMALLLSPLPRSPRSFSPASASLPRSRTPSPPRGRGPLSSVRSFLQRAASPEGSDGTLPTEALSPRGREWGQGGEMMQESGGGEEGLRGWERGGERRERFRRQQLLARSRTAPKPTSSAWIEGPRRMLERAGAAAAEEEGEAAMVAVGWLRGAALRLTCVSRRELQDKVSVISDAVGRASTDSLAFTSRPTAAGISRARWQAFLFLVCAYLWVVGTTALVQYLSEPGWRYARYKFTAELLRDRSTPLPDVPPNVGRVGLMRDGCELEGGEALWREEREGGYVVLHVIPARGSRAGHVFNGWWFETAQAEPDRDPIRFSLHGSTRESEEEGEEGKEGEEGEEGEWVLLGTHVYRLEVGGIQPYWNLDFHTPLERGKRVAFDLRVPAGYVLTMLVNRIFAGILLFCYVLAGVFQRVKYANWIFAAAFFSSGTLLFSGAVCYWLHPREQREGLYWALFSLGGWGIGAVAVVAERYIIAAAVLKGTYLVLLEVAATAFLFQDPSLILLAPPAVGCCFLLGGSFAYVFRFRSLRRSRRLISLDMAKYARMWEHLIAHPPSQDALVRIAEILATIVPEGAALSRQYNRRAAPLAPQSTRTASTDSRRSSSEASDRGLLDAPPGPTPPAPSTSATHSCAPQDRANRRAASLSALRVAFPSLGALSFRQSRVSPDMGPRGASWRGSRRSLWTWMSSARPQDMLLDLSSPVDSLDQLYLAALALQPLLRKKVQQWAAGSRGLFPTMPAGGDASPTMRGSAWSVASSQISSSTDFEPRRAEASFTLWSEAVEEYGTAAAEREIKWGRVKKPQRAIEKLLRSYKGEVCRLLDVCRESIVFETLEDLAECLALISADSQVTVVRAKNKLDRGYNELLTAGYRDVSVNLRIDSPQSQLLRVDNHVCEVQLLLRAFAALKNEDGHARYINFRNDRAE